MQKTTENRTKNPLGGFLWYVISIVVSVIVIVYLGYHFFSGLGGELMTQHALQVTENDVEEFDAYLFRNETVVYSTETGGIGYLYPDGTKVGFGTLLANIYGGNADTSDSTRQTIISIDKKIELLLSSNSTDGFSAADTQTLDSRIDNYYMTIRKSAEEGVYTSLPKRRDEFLTLLNKRQVITGKVKSFDDLIEKLNTARDNLTTGLDTVSEAVTSPATGFFYSSLDGYENVFTGNAVNNLTLEKFDRMISADPSEYDATAIGKVATDFRWYIVIEAGRDQLRFYNEGYSYQVIFPYNNDTQLAMELSDIIAPEGGERILLIFSSHELPEDFSFNRMQTVEVVRSSHTGYKVPISAVRLVDGKMGVYILVGTTVDFKYIDVILECDGYYIVAPRDPQNDPDYATKLGLYDVIITAGRDLFVGKIIK